MIDLLNDRHSVRRFTDTKIQRSSVYDILWAGQGKNRYKYTSPSAGALYPITLYALLVGVDGAPYQSLHRWNRDTSICEYLHYVEEAPSLSGSTAYSQSAFSVFLAADFRILEQKYPNRAERYSYLEAGHIAQNMILMAQSLGIGSVPIGAIQDRKAQAILEIEETPIYLVSFGIEDK